MKLERGMIIKFRNEIECDRKFRNENERDQYFERLYELEGKIATIYRVDFNNISKEPRIEVNEFLGDSFPINYFECVVPTIPIEIPKEYLKDNNIVKLRNGEWLLYSNNLFFKGFSEFCELKDFSYDLKYITAPSGGYDIIKIYENINSETVIWERK